MSRALPKYNKRRVTFIGGAAAVALSGTVIAGFALAGETTASSKSGGTNARTLAGPGTVCVPDVKSKLPASPRPRRPRSTATSPCSTPRSRRPTSGWSTPSARAAPTSSRTPSSAPSRTSGWRRSTASPRPSAGTAARPHGPGLAGALHPRTRTGSAGRPGAATPSAAGGNQQAGNTGNAGNTGAGNTGMPTPRAPSPARTSRRSCPRSPPTAQAEVDRNLTLLNTQITEATSGSRPPSARADPTSSRTPSSAP